MKRMIEKTLGPMEMIKMAPLIDRVVQTCPDCQYQKIVRRLLRGGLRMLDGFVCGVYGISCGVQGVELRLVHCTGSCAAFGAVFRVMQGGRRRLLMH